MNKLALTFIITLSSLFMLATMGGCAPGTTPESKETATAREVERNRLEVLKLNTMAHACDKNGGVTGIDRESCYRGRCSRVRIDCADGMSKILDESNYHN